MSAPRKRGGYISPSSPPKALPVVPSGPAPGAARSGRLCDVGRLELFHEADGSWWKCSCGASNRKLEPRAVVIAEADDHLRPIPRRGDPGWAFGVYIGTDAPTRLGSDLEVPSQLPSLIDQVEQGIIGLYDRYDGAEYSDACDGLADAVEILHRVTLRHADGAGLPCDWCSPQ